MTPHRLLSMLVLCVLPLAAHAQWQWVDAQGRKVFSDQPPPAEVSERQILRRPATASKAVPATSDATPAAPAQRAEAATPTAPKGVDKALEEKARQAEAAEKAARAAQEQLAAKAKQDSCARARQAKATFDSGVRIGRLNERGEREFLDDAARAAELRRVQEVINSDCQ